MVSTFPETEIGTEAIVSFAQSQADSQMMKNYHFFKVYEEHQLEYILIVKSNNDDNYLVGKMAVFQLQGLLVAYRERFDKDNFIKNLLLDNLLLVDIYNRAKKLHIDIETRRLVFIVETDPEKTVVRWKASEVCSERSPEILLPPLMKRALSSSRK